MRRLVALLLLVAACGRGYSDGTRTGMRYKFSRKGIAMKSWEGEMNLGGITSSDTGLAANTWAFTVTDDAVATKIERLEGQRVTVHYVQWFINPPSMDTDYEVVGVEPVQSTPAR